MNSTRFQLLQQVFKFGVTGLFSTAVNYVVYLLILFCAKDLYLFAAAIGFLAGLVAGYPLNRFWTFREGRSSTPRKPFLPLKYALVYFVSLVLGLLSLSILVECLHVDPKYANVLSTFQTICTNFLGLKFLVFRQNARVTQRAAQTVVTQSANESL